MQIKTATRIIKQGSIIAQLSRLYNKSDVAATHQTVTNSWVENYNYLTLLQVPLRVLSSHKVLNLRIVFFLSFLFPISHDVPYFPKIT